MLRSYILLMAIVVSVSGCTVLGPDKETVKATNEQLSKWYAKAIATDNSDRQTDEYKAGRKAVNGWIDDRTAKMADVAKTTWTQKADMTIPADVGQKAEAGLPVQFLSLSDWKEWYEIFKHIWFSTREGKAEARKEQYDQFKWPDAQ